MAVKIEAAEVRMSGPTRQELLEILQCSPVWEDEMTYYTRTELTTLVQKLRFKASKGSTVDQEVKRASRLRKADLQTAVQEAGMTITGQEKIGDLLLAYRKHLKGTLPVEPDEVVDFGQHKGKTFAEVLAKYPDYCVWLRDIFHTKPDACCPGMYRLACWLEGIHPGSQTMPVKEETPPEKPKGSRATGSRGPTPVKQETEEPRPKGKPKVKPTAAKTMARPVFVHPEPGWMPVDPASEVEIPSDQGEEDI